MIRIKKFTFNPFAENTYILFDETNECVIIDPGCMDSGEQKQLTAFIEAEKLTPVRLLNTHCHIDHIFGNRFLSEKYKLRLEANLKDEYNIHSADITAEQWGIPAPNSPLPENSLEEGDIIRFGNSEMKVYFTPGHSAGHVVFHSEDGNFLVGGDVLFLGSVGRTDLTGGDFDTLERSIHQKLFTLSDDLVVYPGHGPETTIGREKNTNPFVGLNK